MKNYRKATVLTVFLTVMVISLILLSSVSSFDSELPYCQGGDEELIICFGDEELTFLAGITPSVPVVGAGGGAPIEPEVIEPEIEVVEKKLIDWVLIILCALLCFILFLLIFRKKKCEYCKQRHWKKNMKKYGKKWYCRNCYSKLSK